MLNMFLCGHWRYPIDQFHKGLSAVAMFVMMGDVLLGEMLSTIKDKQSRLETPLLDWTCSNPENINKIR